MSIKVRYQIFCTKTKAPLVDTYDRTMAYVEFQDCLRNPKGDVYRLEQTPEPDGALTKSEEYLMLVYRVRKLWRQYFDHGRDQEVLKASIEQEKKLDDWHSRISAISENNAGPLHIKDREAFDFYIVVRGWREAWKDRKRYSKQKDYDPQVLSEISKKCRDFEKQIDKYVKDKIGLI